MKGKAFQSKNVRALFLMLDRLVEAQSLPPAVLIVFSIVEHLELLSITLSDTFSDVWGDGPIYRYFKMFAFETFNLRSVAETVGFSAFQAMQIVILVFFVLYIGFLLYVFIDARIHLDSVTPAAGVLGVIVFTVNSVAFLPFLQILMVPYECYNKSGKGYYMSAFPEVECFAGTNMVMILISTGVLAVSIPLVILTIIMCRQTKSDGANLLAGKYTIKRDVIVALFKVVLAATYMSRDTTRTLLNITLLGFTAAIEGVTLNRQIYLDWSMDLFVKCLFSVQIFFVGVVTLGMVTQLSDLFGTSLLCAGLLVVALCCWETYKDYVHGSPNPAMSDMLLDARQLLFALSKFESRRYRGWLMGRVLRHAQSCADAACEINHGNVGEVEQVFRVGSVGRPMEGKADTKLRGRDVLVSYFKRKFLQAMLTYSNCTTSSSGKADIWVKLDYCVFIIEELQNPLPALAILRDIEKAELSFPQRFLVFRYEKFVRSLKIAKDDKDSALQMMNIQQQAFIENFEEMLMDTTQKYIVLWEMLEDESPTYERLLQTCFGLLEQLEEVDQYYTMIYKTRLKNYRIYMLYATFLSDVIHEPTKAKKIMTMAEDFWHTRIANAGLLKDLGASEVKHLTDETPIIIVSGNDSDIGTIINCNSSFGKLFGYTREEITNKDLSMLMPEMYAKHHAEMLRGKKGFETNKEEIFILCQHRCKYVIPAHLKILRMANMLNSFTYVAAVTEKTAFVDSARTYVLLSPELNVIALSSHAWPMLGLTNSWIKDGDLSLTALCPEITPKTIGKFIRGWTQVQYFFPKRKQDPSAIIVDETPRHSSDASPMNDHTLRPSGSPSHALFTGRSALKFSAGTINLPANNLIGYYGVFCSVKEAPEVDDQPGSVRIDRSNRAGDFQFRFDHNANLFVRELAGDTEGTLQRKLTLRSACRAIASQPSMYQDNEGQSKEMSPRSDASSKKGSFYWIQEVKIRTLSRFLSGANSERKELDEVREFVEDYVAKGRPDYSEGIRTFRLLNKNLVEVNENAQLQAAMEEAESVNFSGGAISKKDIRKAKSVSLMLDSLKSKKALGAILRTIRMPRWMKLAFITFIMMLTTLAGMAVGGTLLNQSGIDHVQLNVATTMGQNSVACEIELQSYLDFREMLLIASGTTTDTEKYYNEKPEARYNEVRESLKFWVASIAGGFVNSLTQEMQIKSTAETIKASRDIRLNMYALHPAPVITMVYYLSSIYYNVIQRNMTDINPYSPSEFFVLVNAMPLYYAIIVNSYAFVFASIGNMDNGGIAKAFILCIIGLVTSIVLAVSVFFVYRQILINESRIMMTYLDVPFRQAEKQLLTCQAFLEAAKNEDDQDDERDSDCSPLTTRMTEERANSSSASTSNKRRVFKEKPKIQAGFIATIGILLTTYCVYYALFMYLPKRYISLMLEFGSHLENIMGDASEFVGALVAQREYMISTSTYFAGMPSGVAAIQYLNKIKDSTANEQRLYQYIYSTFKQTDVDTATDILFGNLCNKYSFPANVNIDCATFGNGVLTKGALTTFKYYENLLRENLASYIRSNLTYTNAMFNGDSFHIPNMLVRSMVFPAAKATMDVMYSALNSFTSDVRYYCVLLTALCGILSAVSMAFLLWLGLNANFEMKRMRMTLTLLPIPVLRKIWRFRKYLQQNASSESILIGTMVSSEDKN